MCNNKIHSHEHDNGNSFDRTSIGIILFSPNSLDEFKISGVVEFGLLRKFYEIA